MAKEAVASALLDDHVRTTHEIAVWWGSEDVVASAAAAAAYTDRVEWLSIQQPPQEHEGQIRFVAGGRRFETLPGFPIVLRQVSQ